MAAEQLSSTEIAHRIRAGDKLAEAELSRRFSQGITRILVQLTGNFALAQELCQETLIILLLRLRSQPLDEPEKLPAFVAQVARNLVISDNRKTRRRKTGNDPTGIDETPDDGPDQVDEAQKESAAAAIGKVLSELRSKRDRMLIVRYYLRGEDKIVVCRDLGMTERSFNVVLFRARSRFLEEFNRQGLKVRDFMSLVLL